MYKLDIEPQKFLQKRNSNAILLGFEIKSLLDHKNDNGIPAPTSADAEIAMNDESDEEWVPGVECSAIK